MFSLQKEEEENEEEEREEEDIFLGRPRLTYSTKSSKRRWRLHHPYHAGILFMISENYVNFFIRDVAFL